MKKGYCTIYLVRHGKTDWNEKEIVQGHTDIPLNKEGKFQARNASKELKRIKFDKAYSSDLLRAEQTAEIIAAEHKLLIETTKILRERNFGIFEGQSNEEIREMHRIISTLEEKERYSYRHHPSMESDGEVLIRLLTFLREVAVSNAGKTVLVVTHGGIIRVALIKLGFFTYKNRIQVKNLGYVKLVSDGVDFFIKETSGIENRGNY